MPSKRKDFVACSTEVNSIPVEDCCPPWIDSDGRLGSRVMMSFLVMSNTASVHSPRPCGNCCLKPTSTWRPWVRLKPDEDLFSDSRLVTGSWPALSCA
ncbi:hypothetical protein D3C71_1931080 [compost metagenome]